jgi:hypothetical protein
MQLLASTSSTKVHQNIGLSAEDETCGPLELYARLAQDAFLLADQGDVLHCVAWKV